MTIEELKAENARLKAEVAKWQRCESVACDKMLELCGEIKVLKAEVERLTFRPEHYLDDDGEWVSNIVFYRMQERLKAEVERLTKAGDAMDNAISEIDPQRSERHRFMKMTDAEYLAVMKWRTAKDPNYNRA